MESSGDKTVTFVNAVHNADVWILPQTAANLKTTVWGTPSIAKAKTGESRSAPLCAPGEDGFYLFRSEGVLHWVLYSTEQPPVLLGVFRKEGQDSPWIRCPDTVPQPDAVEEPEGDADGNHPLATAETP